MIDGLYFCNDIISKINSLDEVVIYGAGVMGQALKLCIEAAPYNKKIYRFIVSDTEKNPKTIGGTPVIGVNEADKYKKQTVIVALNESNMPGAVEGLRDLGFNDLIMLNAAGDEWAYIKAIFFLCNQDQCYIPFRMLPDEGKVCNGDK